MLKYLTNGQLAVWAFLVRESGCGDLYKEFSRCIADIADGAKEFYLFFSFLFVERVEQEVWCPTTIMFDREHLHVLLESTSCELCSEINKNEVTS